ncbi:MAG: inorganic phosphate transporter [Bacillota bacterium]|uniref:Inorganic phosphate transporter, PiT family n=2 Tax=Carboxydocella TaxID=178898 RepID=A0A1T4QUM7_9FIRM|nr:MULTISPECIES: inorganic phosphate transporter [Carboxydocella]AVX21659.1 inorganic phosphate transporter, PiT family [Carboxydocella thermautotrophica]AVX32070.1 inorganic phosphate transporter, PiT family [Carboxydocella thermautotrophica]SKA07482.1 inorganic phosphate transporter, PiT family [Carboxydocella sporoproducens DSM 16521]GAW27692.1 inorganic phosphate transporter [Carboxydocella sp. ULO1]GAW31888.1 inorganic phosphate transporter [Carboxydocella sp. JDF658]
MLSLTALVIIVVILALLFDYLNGFHDTANAVATSIATRALSPRQAILLAAAFDFLGAVTHTAVAATIGKGIVDPAAITQTVLIGALSAAIFWNLFTWYYGIPSSSSHALIGGLVGAAAAQHGFALIKWTGLSKIILSLILSPILGLVVGYLVMVGFFWLFRFSHPHQTNNVFRRLQILSAALTAYSHGSNDAQKSMGLITMALVSAGMIDTFHVPFWVVVACASALALGTATGGKKIIRTMGGRIFKIEPINGFASDISSSLVILLASRFGLPVSTTHVVASALMGVGTAKNFRGVKWGVARQIITAWFLTLPATSLIGAGVYLALELLL